MEIREALKTTDNEVISVLMVGQSNMAGRGNIDDVDPIRNPNCYMLRMGRWQPMLEPVNPDRSVFDGEFRSGISLAASFADELSNQLQKPVGLIPCAAGGTKIAEWMPGELLFDHAVIMTQLAMRTSRLGGIIWHQGESDYVNGDLELYKRNLITMLTELRRQLHAQNLPLVLGELSPATFVADWAEKVNAILPEVAQQLPNCAVASAEGLTIKPDKIHFDARSLREYGVRYYKEFLPLYERTQHQAI